MKDKATEYLNSKDIDVSVQTVSQLVKHGVISHSALRDMAIVQEVRSGASTENIEHEYRCSSSTIWRATRTYGD